MLLKRNSFLWIIFSLNKNRYLTVWFADSGKFVMFSQTNQNALHFQSEFGAIQHLLSISTMSMVCLCNEIICEWCNWIITSLSIKRLLWQDSVEILYQYTVRLKVAFGFNFTLEICSFFFLSPSVYFVKFSLSIRTW